MGAKNQSEWIYSFSRHIDPGNKAMCKNVPQDRMYEKADRNTSEQLCHRCECLPRCRCYAIWGKEDDGIWGGMTSEHRASFRRIHTERRAW